MQIYDELNEIFSNALFILIDSNDLYKNIIISKMIFSSICCLCFEHLLSFCLMESTVFRVVVVFFFFFSVDAFGVDGGLEGGGGLDGRGIFEGGWPFDFAERMRWEVVVVFDGDLVERICAEIEAMDGLE